MIMNFNMKNFNRAIFLLGMFAVLMWTSCKTDKINGLAEPTKDITGTWKVVKATRNGTDLLSLVDANYYDYSKFTVKFSAGKYTLTNPLPFIVSADGTYSLDNPEYPFKITFTQAGASSPVSTNFTYPIVNGARTLTLVFSPGCTNNTYSYTLQKVN